MESQNSIRSFYEDKVIFITGGSGFLGKVITEKLLRSCPKIKKIYMLLRSKKGRTSEERLKSLFNLELFRGLRCKAPHFDEKVQAIAGDMLVDGLGIGEEDRLLLQDNVNIVIHSAATV